MPQIPHIGTRRLLRPRLRSIGGERGCATGSSEDGARAAADGRIRRADNWFSVAQEAWRRAPARSSSRGGRWGPHGPAPAGGSIGSAARTFSYQDFTVHRQPTVLKRYHRPVSTFA